MASPGPPPGLLQPVGISSASESKAASALAFVLGFHCSRFRAGSPLQQVQYGQPPPRGASLATPLSQPAMPLVRFSDSIQKFRRAGLGGPSILHQLPGVPHAAQQRIWLVQIFS